MYHRILRRIGALILCLALALSLFAGAPVYADNEIWTEDPTGWRHWSHVIYERKDGHLCNWGVRGETAYFLSSMALDYYSDNPWDVTQSWGWFAASEYAGGTGAEDARASALYAFLHSFLAGKQTHVTDYGETRQLYRYTDCMVSDADHISSFYSGIRLNGAWDSGATWNREHTWPKSKASGSQNGDIMMLRPTSVRENSGRGNLAYGESQGFYHPNREAGNTGLDLRGDCARICLYCYVRWSENAGNMWGAEGVMESLDVLLDWMEQDPVDTWEMGRNDAAEDITGVRNCFVDYPELAWALFGREVPANYPTPMNGGQEWPPVTAVGAAFSAVPDDPAHGSVVVVGLCATPSPAEGYYVSGYDVVRASPWYVDPEDPSPYDGLLAWNRGRLLCLQTREVEVSVVIHFTPEGETEPFRFEDVTNPERYYYEPVYWAYRHDPQITSGTDETHFSPHDPCTREQIMTFVWKAFGAPTPGTDENPFTDVKPTKYYYNAILWAVENGITSGMEPTLFGVGQPCTRAQVVTFLWNALGKPEPETTENPFGDVRQKDYFYKAVLWAVENGITTGTSETAFSPKDTCTRAQVVTFLYKALR